MTLLLTALLATAPPALAQGRVQVSYEVIVAQVPAKDELWKALGRKFEALDAAQAEAVQTELAKDSVAVVARPMMTALANQETFFQKSSGEEYIKATMKGAPAEGGFQLEATVEMDVTNGPITWSGLVPTAEDELSVLAVRPKKGLVVVIRMREAGAR